MPGQKPGVHPPLSIPGSSPPTSSLASIGGRQCPPARNSKRGQGPLTQHSTTETTQSTSTWISQGNNENYWRVLGKWRNQTPHNHRSRQHKVLGTSIPQTKKGERQDSPHHRSQRSQWVPPGTQAQDRNLENNPAHTAGQVPHMGPNPGSSEFFPPPANAPQPTEMDENPSTQSELPTYGNALWLGIEPLVVQQNDQANKAMAEQPEMGTQLVRGRHHATGILQGRDRGQSSPTHHTVNPLGDQGEQREKHAPSSTDIRLSGTPDKSAPQHCQSPTAEIEVISEDDKTSNERDDLPTQAPGRTSREPAGCSQIQHLCAGTAPAADEGCSTGSPRQSPTTETLEHSEVLVHVHPQSDSTTSSSTPLPSSSPATSPTGAPPIKRPRVHFAHRCKQLGLGSTAVPPGQGNPYMCTTLDTSGETPAHNTFGSPGQLPCSRPPPAPHPSRKHSATEDRCSVNSLGVEKGVQNTKHQQPHHSHAPPGSQETHPDSSPAHSRDYKQKGRLAVQKSRPQILPAQPHSLPQSVPTLPILPQHRSLCQQAQSASEDILQLEDRPPEQRGCLPNQLGTLPMLAESPMGDHTQVPAESPTGTCQSTSVPTSVAISTLVENPAGSPHYQPPGSEASAPLPKPRRGGATPTSLGDPFWGHSRMTSQQIRNHLRMLECQQDIPATIRMQWIQSAMHITSKPRDHVMMRQSIQRLKNASRRAKHPVFFSIQPLLQHAFPEQHTPLSEWSMDHLLDILILQLRLTTLMRSVDIANIAFALFHQDGVHFVRATDKKGEATTFSITGFTLYTLLEYMHRHLNQPALFLFRYTKDPSQCLGSERLAKRLLQVMQQCGIDTATFKAHSLRGATATHLLAKGTPISHVQARGHWSSLQTLDVYYNRLHQQIDWETHLLGGHAEGRHDSAACAVLPPSAPQADPTKEGESWGDKGESTAQAAALAAQGVLRALYDSTHCPSCTLPMQKEAAYKCTKCRSIYHVRCMGHYASVGNRQLRYGTMCFLCTMASTLKPNPPHDMHAHDPSTGRGTGSDISSLAGRTRDKDPLIIDVMGVCD